MFKFDQKVQKEVSQMANCNLSCIISDSKSCLSGFKLATQWTKHSLFGTFLVGGGDIRYWLEMTSFWFVMVSLVTSNVGG